MNFYSYDMDDLFLIQSHKDDNIWFQNEKIKCKVLQNEK